MNFRCFPMIPFVSMLLSLAPVASNAEVTVFAILQGSATVRTSAVVHHRRSADCYVMGKGDDHQDYGSQTVSYNMARAIIGSGQTNWLNNISAPFPATARNTILTSQVTDVDEGAQVAISLQDHFAGSLGKIHGEKCRHTDGFVTVNDATIEGRVTVKYVVPANVWALRVVRSNHAGVFSVKNLTPLQGSLNPGYDKGLRNETILWVKPGQAIEQVITVPKYVGAASLGSLSIQFLPLGPKQNAEFIKTFMEKVKGRVYQQKFTQASANEFLRNTMSMVRAGKDLSTYTKALTLFDLKQTSDRFFEIANSVIELEEGHAIKTAAALASFQISQAILMEMTAYCQDVEVYLPFTGEKQKVLGLKAASFWLTRSMNNIKTYSYQPLEDFLEKLQGLQDKGMTPALMAKDPKVRDEVQKSHLFLTKTMNLRAGPFNRAYVDYNNMTKAFNNQTLGAQQLELMATLKKANQEEDELISAFSGLFRQMRANNNTMLDIGAVSTKIESLKSKQTVVPQQMREALRLLTLEPTNDEGTVMNQVVDLLNHQVNIFKQPVDVPYFDGIRAAFYEANVKDFRAVTDGCFQLEGVNP